MVKFTVYLNYLHGHIFETVLFSKLCSIVTNLVIVLVNWPKPPK